MATSAVSRDTADHTIAPCTQKDLPVRTASLHAARLPRVRAPHVKSNCVHCAARSPFPAAVPLPPPRHPCATPSAPARPPLLNHPYPHCLPPLPPRHDFPPPPRASYRRRQRCAGRVAWGQGGGKGGRRGGGSCGRFSGREGGGGGGRGGGIDGGGAGWGGGRRARSGGRKREIWVRYVSIYSDTT